MNHSTIKATILPTVIHLIMDRYHLTEAETLDKFYRSATGLLLQTMKPVCTANRPTACLACMCRNGKKLDYFFPETSKCP